MYKIFIVEDDEAIANAVRKSLEAWDYEVKCCGDFRNVSGEFSEFLSLTAFIIVRRSEKYPKFR